MLTMARKGIDSIFEKDARGEYYNKKARLYQDMLIFGSKLNENEPFKLWDLAKFLLENNEELRDRYKGEKMKNKNKIENIQRRIKRNVESLVNLRLMIQTGLVKEERGTDFVPTFSYTRVGYVFSRIIQCVGLGKENAEEELYTLFSKRLYKVEEDSPSLLIFASKFIKKIYEKGLFGAYISTFQKVLDSEEVADIESFANLIQKLLSPWYQTKLFVSTWVETINELEPLVRKLYMYDQKLVIDIKMGSKALSKEYEKLRLELRGETERIVLEGVCNACKQRSVFPMEIIEYTLRLANADLIHPSVKCSKCNASQQTLQLPNLWV
jgi:hypothetical protein